MADGHRRDLRRHRRCGHPRRHPCRCCPGRDRRPARHREFPGVALYGVGVDTAAALLVAAGDHPERLRSEAAWAHLCAAAPVPSSSGKGSGRLTLDTAGDRHANHALWRIVFTRMSAHPATRTYVERRTIEGKTKQEIMRCLKRYVARETFPHLRSAVA